MTPNQLSMLHDIKRTLENIRSYCDNHSLIYDEQYERWKHVASEANYGLIKVRDIERSAK